MQVVADGGVPEASLEDVAVSDGPRSSPDIAGIATGNPLHVRRKLIIPLGLEHEMKVVGHQAVRVHLGSEPARAFVEQPHKRPVISRLKEDRAPVVPSIDDVMRCAGGSASVSSGHVRRPPSPPVCRNRRSSFELPARLEMGQAHSAPPLDSKMGQARFQAPRLSGPVVQSTTDADGE
jgi:hypothetical protein